MNERPSTSSLKSRHRGGNLPAEATSFVDRRKEISAARQALSATRLLTLTGVGGVGKTRLAVRVAAGLRRAFTDGVWLVELATLQDHTLLDQTVADTIGLHDRSARSPREAVVDHLHDKQLLLVLDNCEHLADRCAELSVDLLVAAPGLRILATSRHALGISAEHVLAVPPLPLPDPETPIQQGKLVSNQAIRLFAERAAPVRPGFTVDDRNHATLARICHQLDGLPLAIELAAAWLRVLSLEQILHRLDNRFQFLRGGSRAVLPRHQTLRAVVDWSYELCSPPERVLWARVSVFAGGFNLEAAEAVCAGDGVDSHQVLDLVAGLVDKSILIREDQAHSPQAHYRLLDTIRHYGQEALRRTGHETALRRRHRDHYLNLAEQAEARWFGPDQLEIAARIRSEHANLRLALEFCLSTPGESRAGLRLAGVLYFYWLSCGLSAEGRHWLDRALSVDTEPTGERAAALTVNAHLAVTQGDIAGMATMAQESRDLAEQLGDEATLAYATANLGAAAWQTGDPERARELFENALARFEATGELTTTLIIAYNTSTMALYPDDLARATEVCRRSLERCERHGEKWARAYTLFVLANIEWQHGELAQASTHAMDSLRIAHTFKDTIGTVVAVELLAWIAGMVREAERAAVLLGAAHQIWALVGGESLLQSSPHWTVPHKACEQRARQALGDLAFQAAFDRGADFDPDHTVAYALGEKRTPAAPADAATAEAGTQLTRREQQVAELVAQGLTNKQIAAQLVIARRTAEGHVARIMTKLGFATRTQLSVWILQQEKTARQLRTLSALNSFDMSARARRSAGNLPAELTSFVGRRRDLGEVKRLLSAGRLVTLTGTGGVGKTRLAIRVAADVHGTFPDGAWLVQLADLRDPQLLPNTVAIALGLRGAAATDTAGLVEHLEDRRLLLVLDNCEHMTDECAALVAKLLAACEGVRTLATSRHMLHVEGEHVLHVQPLAVPPTGNKRASPSDAVMLFVERAAAVLPGFELTPGNRTVVIGICERLEGIPLAIELAAVRMRALSADQILRRLDNRFSLLAARPQAPRTRQRTLEAAIDWSFELCSPEEQRLWARLSVFPGGFDLEAAEHAYAPDAAGRRCVLDMVTGLVDKSVLSRQDGTSGRQAWYRMLDTVREYAGAKLAESGDEQDVRARQVEHYLNLAGKFGTEVFGPRQLEWLARLRREHVNLRAVLEYCLSQPDRATQSLAIASTLWHYWYGGGHEFEGYRYLRRGLKLCNDRTIVRARALHAASFFAILSGAADVPGMLTELAALAEELDDEWLRAGHAECAGMARNLAGDLTGGADLLERALTGFRAAGDEHQVFDTLILLANVRFFLADPRGAAAADEALALAGRHQARWSRCWALWAVATHRWRVGEHQQAANLVREAIALRLADRMLLAFLVEALAWCSSSDAEHDRTARLLGCAHAVWRLTGARIDEMSPYRDLDDQCAAGARAVLGSEEYDSAFAEGAGFGLEEVIRYALRERPTRSSRPERAGEPATLTKREQEIAELVARGMSNNDIAAALVIGRRTVESHIDNVLKKLGLTSRTQVASWLSGRPPRSP